MKTIKVSDQTFARLEQLVVGFDTPDAVIRRLIEGRGATPDNAPKAPKVTPSVRRDRTKFAMDGHVLAMNRLVLAVVKQYVLKNPDIVYAELESVFPKRLQGSMGVFALEEDAKEVYERTGHKRHFISPPELVELNDATIAVCSQWSKGNIDDFVETAQKLGLEINRID